MPLIRNFLAWAILLAGALMSLAALCVAVPFVVGVVLLFLVIVLAANKALRTLDELRAAWRRR